MNRIDKMFKEKKANVLSVYFTAGYPQLDSTMTIIKALEDAGADMIEIGMPFSDPMADGPVIQRSNEQALRNGMSIKLLFSQLKNIRPEVKIPIILMGYFNPVLQFGAEDFCRKCKETGVDGVILPDLPVQIYLPEYQAVFEKYGLYNILLVSPQSGSQRILEIDNISRGFIYMVSSSSVTGARGQFTADQIKYFTRVGEMDLRNPCLIGFGISDSETFSCVCNYARGGIIGSAFVKLLAEGGNPAKQTDKFIKGIRSTGT
jgi:tryptophan synthase alpha chain